MRKVITSNNYSSIDEYIATFPDNVQSILSELRSVIKRIAPDAKEKISYKMPTFTIYGNLVHFAGYDKHIGFYPAPSAIEKFKNELKEYKTSKGAIQFPLDESIPYELITRIVDFRVKENINKFQRRKNLKTERYLN